jgi:hypothetical protein
MPEAGNKKLSLNPRAQQILIKCAEQGLSDKEIQKRLIAECGYEWHVKSISRCRRNSGVVKKSGRPVNVDVPSSPMLASPPLGLNDVEKAAWFRDQFQKTHMYTTIQKQFEPDEVETYLEDFGLLCCQFEDIVISEFMQVDDFLKHRILVDQQLTGKRFIQRDVNNIQAWFIANPKKEEEDKDTIRFRLAKQRQLEAQQRALNDIGKRYDELIKTRTKIYDGLAATRLHRLDELRGGKASFLELVSKMQYSQEERDKQGILAELTNLAAEDVKNEFRKPTKFPDGSIEPIIMDSETDFGDGN